MMDIAGLGAKRTIIHLDLDAFYAQVEQKRKGVAEGTPLAVQQWDGLIAVNYAARARGVTRHMRTAQAKEACPELVFVHVQTIGAGGTSTADAEGSAQARGSSKACLQRYRVASSHIMQALKQQLAHGAVLEKGGLDEVFVDVTPMVEQELRRYTAATGTTHPQPAEAVSAGEPLDAREDPQPVCDLHQAGSSSAVRSFPAGPLHASSLMELTQQVQEYSILEGGISADLDLESDRRLVIAAALAKQLRNAVLQDPSCGYTCSAGIAPNKLLAKVGSARNKPNKQTLILPRAVAGLMQSLPLSKLRGLGGKLGNDLQAAFPSGSAGDMQRVPLEQLTRVAGDRAWWVFNMVRGICDEPVKPKGPIKSLNSCKSFQPTSNMQEISKWMELLAEELAERIADDEWEHHRRPKSLVLQYRGGRGNPGDRSVRCSMPPHNTSAGPSAPAIQAAALAMFKKLTDALPCARLALCATEFYDPPADGSKAITRFFAPVSTGSQAPGADASSTSPQTHPPKCTQSKQQQLKGTAASRFFLPTTQQYSPLPLQQQQQQHRQQSITAQQLSTAHNSDNLLMGLVTKQLDQGRHVESTGNMHMGTGVAGGTEAGQQGNSSGHQNGHSPSPVLQNVAQTLSSNPAEARGHRPAEPDSSSLPISVVGTPAQYTKSADHDIEQLPTGPAPSYVLYPPEESTGPEQHGPRRSQPANVQRFFTASRNSTPAASPSMVLAPHHASVPGEGMHQQLHASLQQEGCGGGRYCSSMLTGDALNEQDDSAAHHLASSAAAGGEDCNIQEASRGTVLVTPGMGTGQGLQRVFPQLPLLKSEGLPLPRLQSRQPSTHQQQVIPFLSAQGQQTVAQQAVQENNMQEQQQACSHSDSDEAGAPVSKRRRAAHHKRVQGVGRVNSADTVQALRGLGPGSATVSKLVQQQQVVPGHALVARQLHSILGPVGPSSAVALCHQPGTASAQGLPVDAVHSDDAAEAAYVPEQDAGNTSATGTLLPQGSSAGSPQPQVVAQQDHRAGACAGGLQHLLRPQVNKGSPQSQAADVIVLDGADSELDRSMEWQHTHNQQQQQEPKEQQKQQVLPRVMTSAQRSSLLHTLLRLPAYQQQEDQQQAATKQQEGPAAAPPCEADVEAPDSDNDCVVLSEVDLQEQRRILRDVEVQRLLALGKQQQGAAASKSNAGNGKQRHAPPSRKGTSKGKGAAVKQPSRQAQLSITGLFCKKD